MKLQSTIVLIVVLSFSVAFAAEFTAMGGGAGGRFSDVVIDPTDADTVFVSGDNTGVWKTIDGGDSWRCLNANGLINSRVADLEMDPHNPAILYAATQGGPFVTTDGGQSWKSLRVSAFPAVDQRWETKYWAALSCIRVCPNDPEVIFAGCGGSTGYRRRQGLKYVGYRSLDGGKTWLVIPNGKGGPDVGKGLAVSDFAWQADNPGRVWMATNQGLFSSRDRGESWQRHEKGLPPLPVSSLAVVQSRPGRIIASLSAKEQGGIYLSDNGGIDFNNIDLPNQLGNMPCRRLKVQDKDGLILYAASHGRLLYSRDAGSTWANLGKPVHHGFLNFWGSSILEFDASSTRSETIFVATDYILKSPDHGKHWEAAYTRKSGGRFENRGLVNTSPRSILVDPDDARHILIGELDIGLSESRDGGITWRNYHEQFRKMTDSPWECFALGIDSKKTIYALAGRRSRNVSWLLKREKGDVWQAIKRFAAGRAEMAIEIDGAPPETTLWVTLPGRGVARWDVELDRWSVHPVGNNYPVTIRKDPLAANTLYAGCRFHHQGGRGGFYRSVDGGVSWTLVAPYNEGLSDVWSIAIHPGDSRIIAVGTRGYQQSGTGGIYLSRDAGKIWERCDKTISIAFEDPGKAARRWARAVAFSNDGRMLFAGFSDDGYDFNMDKGIYFSLDTGRTFTKLNGLPHGAINTLSADSADAGVLWVGTEGGGVYRVELADNSGGAADGGIKSSTEIVPLNP